MKRMFAKFDVFFMIRFLNNFGETSHYVPVDVEIAVGELLDYYGVIRSDNLYDDILELDASVLN